MTREQEIAALTEACRSREITISRLKDEIARLKFEIEKLETIIHGDIERFKVLYPLVKLSE